MSRLLISLLVASGMVHAECYTRSTATAKSLARVERVADVQRSVLPEGAGQVKCRVTFRALIGEKWYTAEGENIGPASGSFDQICTAALNVGRTTILTSVAGTSMPVDQDMMCTDEPIPKPRALVAVGDVVKDSELLPHPQHRSLFQHRGSVCRWFIESSPEVGRVDMNQGIMCRAPEQTDWKVVDKW